MYCSQLMCQEDLSNNMAEIATIRLLLAELLRITESIFSEVGIS